MKEDKAKQLAKAKAELPSPGEILVGADGIDVTPAEYWSFFDATNQALLAVGCKKVKTRLSHDLSQSGVNGASRAAPFKTTQFTDILAQLKRGDVLGKTDVVSYFNLFALAKCSRRFFCFCLGEAWFEYLFCGFGYKLSPAFADTFTAELLRWIWIGLGILAAAAYCDDFITAARKEAECKSNLARIKTLLKSIGMDTDKDECGQQVEYLGRLIDTVSMTITISGEKVKGERMLLEQLYREKIVPGHKVPRATLQHFGGVVNWYAETVAGARIYAHIFWIAAEKGDRLTHRERAELVRAAEWFLGILRKFEQGQPAERQHRIYSSEVIATDPMATYLVQTDEAGEDGIGG
jgi:hypothetical protein